MKQRSGPNKYCPLMIQQTAEKYVSKPKVTVYSTLIGTPLEIALRMF